jgi:hypothetical protein
LGFCFGSSIAKREVSGLFEIFLAETRSKWALLNPWRCYLE